MGITITKTGKTLPEFVLTNKDLEKMVDTDNQWIIDRTGIEERHIAIKETSVDLASASAEIALTETDRDTIDLLIIATVSPDKLVPCMGSLVKERLGLKNAAAFDVNAACSGFMYGVWVAEALMIKNNFKKALVIGTECLSRITNWEDRNTCIIFGDGAGCALLENNPEKKGILSSFVKNYDDTQKSLVCGFEYLKRPFDTESGETDPDNKMFIRMNGTQVFRFAVNAIEDVMNEVLKAANLSHSDIAYYVPHQANMRIISAAANKTGQPIDKFQISIRQTGNVSAASVPMALHDLMTSGKVKEGDKIMLMGFGGGLSAGALIFEV